MFSTARRWSLVAISLSSVVLATPLSTSHYVSTKEPLTIAPLIEDHHPHGTVNNSYIIMLKEGVSASLLSTHLNFVNQAHGASALVGDGLAGVIHVYDQHFNGYAGHFSEQVIEQIRRLPEVEYVEKDQIVQALDVQRSAPWGLARISHRKKLSFSTFSSYIHNPQGGEGVDVYVIDTGINIDHVEFQGRAHWGKTIPQDDEDKDGNGHGTHCAGTIASRKYGVAKKAHVYAVKVLGSNGSGTMSDVVKGVDWAATQAGKKAKAAKAERERTGSSAHKGSVANMSLGGGKSPSLDRVVNAAVKSGLHFAVAAGNDNRDACDYSPAGAENAVTVGASTLSDERAYFSNWGKCVDVFAPGLNILSTWTGSRTATSTISGTSMASPHVAGLLAYLLSIFPSKDFEPTFDSSDSLISLTSQRVFASEPLSIYAMAHRSLPNFITSYLPSPKFLDKLIGAVSEELAPLPAPGTLTPAQLKKAVIALATEGILRELPANTVNLLVFNNATA